MPPFCYLYTPGAIEALAAHYFDEHRDVLAIDAFADYERSLHWLRREAPELERLLRQWMVGYLEADLALAYHLRARTLARLLDQTFSLLADYLNDSRPLEIPVLSALQAGDSLLTPPYAAPDPVLLAITTLSMSFALVLTTIS